MYFPCDEIVNNFIRWKSSHPWWPFQRKKLQEYSGAEILKSFTSEENKLSSQFLLKYIIFLGYSSTIWRENGSTAETWVNSAANVLLCMFLMFRPYFLLTIKYATICAPFRRRFRNRFKNMWSREIQYWFLWQPSISPQLDKLITVFRPWGYWVPLGD